MADSTVWLKVIAFFTGVIALPFLVILFIMVLAMITWTLGFIASLWLYILVSILAFIIYSYIRDVWLTRKCKEKKRC